MKNCKKELLVLTLLFLIFSVIFWGQSSNFLIDFSREITIPYQMNNNQKLFTDIFLIYGFWGYFINSFLFKILNNINVLLLEAVIISYFITLSFYFIAKQFLKNIEAFLFTLFLIFCSIFSCATFSFVVPYSYSVLWAYFASYILLFSLLYNQESLVYLSLGLIFVSKIELFVPLFLFIVIYKIISKEKFNLKFLYTFVFPCIFLIYLFLNNITYSEILNNFSYINKMIHTEAIKYFYSGMGVFFNKSYFVYNIENFLIYFLVFALTYFLHKKNKKNIGIIILILYFLVSNAVFISNLVIFVLIILFIYCSFKNKISKNDVTLFAFSLILSLKTIFALNIFGYGNFSYILVIFNIFVLLSKILDKNYIKIHFLIFLLCLSLTNIKYMISDRKMSLETHHGKIFFKNENLESFVELNKFINSNVSKDENFVVLPEGQIFSYLNNKKWQFYNSTFTPLDFETFGDEYFIQQLQKNNIDYVIIYPRDTKDYKKNNICIDYGVDFCKFIIDNYYRNDILNKYNIVIYKKR